MDAHALAERIQARLGEHGPAALDELGLGRDWAAVLATVPAPVWTGPASGRLPALSTLMALRQHWMGAQAWRPAAAVTRALIRVLTDLLGADHPDTLGEVAALGAIALGSGRAEAAVDVLRRAWSGLHEASQWRRLPQVGLRYADALAATGQVEAATAVLQTCWRLVERLDADRLAVGGRLGELLLTAGSAAEAAEVLDTTWHDAARRRGEHVPAVWSLARQLARASQAAGQPERAEAALRSAVTHGRDAPAAWAEAALQLAAILERRGPSEEAWRLADEALRWTRARDEAHPALPQRLAQRARMLMARRRVGEAEGVLHEALEHTRRRHGDDGPEVARRYAALGRLCVRSARHDEAIGWLEPALSLLGGVDEPVADEAARDLAEALARRAEDYARSGDEDLAAQCVARVQALAEDRVGHDHPAVRRARRVLPGGRVGR